MNYTLKHMNENPCPQCATTGFIFIEYTPDSEEFYCNACHYFFHDVNVCHDYPYADCPFCGERPTLNHVRSAIVGEFRYTISCQNCSVESARFLTIQDAENFWNKRFELRINYNLELKK